MRKKKALKLNIQHDPSHLGPNGQPLLYGTPEQPAAITGQVVFETDHDTKGEELQITISAILKVKCCDNEEKVKRFTQMVYFDIKILSVNLMHVAPGKIKAGRYTADINFPIPAHFPSSMYLNNGSFEYRVRAVITPKADIVQDSIIWVLNSNMTNESRHGKKLSPCLIPKIPNESVSQSHPNSTEKPLENAKKLLSVGPPCRRGHNGSATGLTFTCEIPTTILIAGEILAITIKAVPDQRSASTSGYTPSALSKNLQSGLLSKLHGKYHGQDEFSKMPTIRTSLEQLVSYQNLRRKTWQHEKREFASVFQFDEAGGALLHSSRGGWNVVLKVILPRLGAKRVDLEKLEVQDELKGLKGSIEHSLLKVEHSLMIELKYNTTVRRFKVPVTIIPSGGPGPVPPRFDHIRWTSESVSVGGFYDSIAPAKMDLVDTNAKLTRAAKNFLRAARHHLSRVQEWMNVL